MSLDLVKQNELREIVSHEAITKAVNSIWNQEIFTNNGNALLNSLFSPKKLFYLNVLSDFLFFMILSLMMLTGMCNKGKDEFNTCLFIHSQKKKSNSA